MKLVLCPQDKQKRILCELKAEKTVGRGSIQTEEVHPYHACVYADLAYSVYIESEQDLRKLKFRVNGEMISGTFVPSSNDPHYGEFRPSASEYEDRQWFRDCCGFARVEVESAAEGLLYCTEYLEVMIRQNQKEMYAALQGMSAYVSRMNRRYLSAEEQKSAIAGAWENGKKILRDKIALLREISEAYERNCGYFRSKPYSQLDSGYHVDDFRKLQHLSPVTMDYIVGHPDDLIPTDSPYGIRFQNRSYLPSKTLVRNTEPSRECYENSVLLGFFDVLFRSMDDLTDQIDSFLRSVPLTGQQTAGYESSASAILSIRGEDLKQELEEIHTLKNTLQALFWRYRMFLPDKPLCFTELPMPTQVFLSAGPYRQIYALIHRWFDLGNPDLFREAKFLLPLTLNYSLYEYYVLCKIAEAVENQGLAFVPEESCCFHYEIPDKRYIQPEHTNTFVFRSGELRVTLYYQPVIYTRTAAPEMRNGLELCRVTTMGIKSTSFPDRKDAFYTPDFAMKIQGKEGDRYLIGDAKFRMFDPAQVPDLVFKYYFSLRPLSSRDVIAGTTIFYGKHYAEEAALQSVYDVFYDGTVPDFSFAFLTESPECTPDSQQRMLAELLTVLRTTPAA